MKHILLKKSNLLNSVFLLITFIAGAQPFLQQINNNTGNQPEATTMMQNIYDRCPAEYKTGIYKNMSYYHAAITANDLNETLFQDNYYTNWTELEEYLYQIFRLIAPPEIANDSLFRIIIMKDGHFNASMSPGGVMAINIGLFDNLQDESTIAGIMAHELSHYMLNHSLRTYISYRTGDFDKVFRANEELFNRYTSKLEFQADSMAVVIISKSPYSLQGLIQAFDLMTLVDRNMNALTSGGIDYDETTHPSPEIRKQRLIGYCSKHNINKENKFVVNHDLFYKIKQRAKHEILNCLMEQFSFDECTEKAFKYHLIDPSNRIYIRYIAESIRRNCYGNTEKWNKLFITNRYYDRLVNDKFRVEMKTSLLEKFNADILTMSEAEIDSMKAGFYWDGSKRFSTMEEAYNYFVKVGNILKEPEIYLSNALSFTNDTLSRQVQIQKYLSNNTIAFPEYAYYMHNDSLEVVLPSKRLIVLDYMDAKVRVGKFEVILNPASLDTSIVVKQMLDSFMINSDSTLTLYLPGLKNTDLEKYLMLKTLMQFSFWTTISFGEPVYFYILEPEYWHLFKELGVNQIDFIKCRISDCEKFSKNPEQYWQIATTPVSEVINNKSALKYFDMAMSQVSITKDHKPRTSYFDTNIHLTRDENGINQIINILKGNRIKFEKKNKFVTADHKNR
jgi:hypothetical protein